MHFESADAGASLTYPQQAGTVRKNGFLVIKGRPCKVRRQRLPRPVKGHSDRKLWRTAACAASSSIFTARSGLGLPSSPL